MSDSTDPYRYGVPQPVGGTRPSGKQILTFIAFLTSAPMAR
jgi:hypothetical protein